MAAQEKCYFDSTWSGQAQGSWIHTGFSHTKGCPDYTEESESPNVTDPYTVNSYIAYCIYHDSNWAGLARKTSEEAWEDTNLHWKQLHIGKTLCGVFQTMAVYGEDDQVVEANRKLSEAREISESNEYLETLLVELKTKGLNEASDGIVACLMKIEDTKWRLRIAVGVALQELTDIQAGS